MAYATRSDFRADMATYLKKAKKWEVLYIGTREDKEFVVIPCELIDEEDIAALQSKELAELVEERRKQKTVWLDELSRSV